MAVDEALLTCYPRLQRPTLRLYGWERPTLSLGHFQRAEDVDMAACRSRGVEVVRRPTGGRAVLHGCEVTYSVVAGLERFPQGVAASYRHISRALILALSELGLAAQWQRQHTHARSAVCFEAPALAELTIEGKKVTGSAQTRTRHALLQHGAVPLALDWTTLAAVFKLNAGALDALKRRAAGLNDFDPGLDAERVREALIRSFSAALGPLVPAELSPHERTVARRLLQKYERVEGSPHKEVVDVVGR